MKYTHTPTLDWMEFEPSKLDPEMRAAYDLACKEDRLDEFFFMLPAPPRRDDEQPT